MDNREYSKLYYQKNHEKLRTQQKKYAQEHREQILKWKHNHKEQHRITNLVWKNKNREKIRIYEREFHSKIRRGYIDLLSRKCVKCGLVSNQDCIYDFHHIDKNDKESLRECATKGFIEKIRAKKIILLCANCHRLEHHKKDEALIS